MLNVEFVKEELKKMAIVFITLRKHMQMWEKDLKKKRELVKGSILST